MDKNIINFMDFEKVNRLLEDFNKSTGFVTAILDLEGNVLSQSGWREICTVFHRKNPETAHNCLISDTELANKMTEGSKYHFYKCLNGLVDVATPIMIEGEHVANLFTGQFFFEKPDFTYFKKQAEKYGFDEEKYLSELEKVPVFTESEAAANLNFLSNMAHLIGELTSEKLKQAELNERLQKSESLFKNIFDKSNIGKSITLKDGDLSVNQAFADMLGYSVEELQKLKWQDLTPSEEIEPIQKLIEPLIQGLQDSVRFEKRYIRKDGNIVWADVSTTIQRDETENPEHFITAVVDISDRKAAELEIKRLNALLQKELQTRTAELSAAEKNYQEIFNASPVSIWKEDWKEVVKAIRKLQATGTSDFENYFNMNPDFVTWALDAVKVIDVNNYTLDLFEAGDKQQLLKSLGTVFSTSDLIPGFTGELIALGSGKYIYETEMKLRKLDDQLIEVLLRMTFPQPEDDSGIVFVSLMDISYRKQMEEELKETNQQLELANKTLETKLGEIERMNKLFVGREIRMKELKEKIKEMENR